jgi:hypothetical protein
VEDPEDQVLGSPGGKDEDGMSSGRPGRVRLIFTCAVGLQQRRYSGGRSRKDLYGTSTSIREVMEGGESTILGRSLESVNYVNSITRAALLRKHTARGVSAVFHQVSVGIFQSLFFCLHSSLIKYLSRKVFSPLVLGFSSAGD